MAEAASSSARLLAEFDREAASTRRILERVPDGKFDWKPHPKSMTLGGLANHVSGLMGFAPIVLQTESMDVAAPSGQPRPAAPTSARELVESFDRGVAASRAAIAAAGEQQLSHPWSLRNGETVLFNLPRDGVLRLQLSHMVHHRGQLSVYLRLNDVPVPGMYGPSADER